MWKKTLFALLAAFLLRCVLYTEDKSDQHRPQDSEVSQCNPSEVPKFWLAQKNTQKSTHWASSIQKILLKLGLEKVENDATSADTLHYDWDLLWSFPFWDYLPLNLSRLEYYQKINHLPGSYLLSAKSHLSVYTKSKYIPRGFTNITELKAYAESHPNTRFVQKLKANRGVSLKTIDQMNISAIGEVTKTHFAQVFVEDPFLIAGHKFDFNIYVVITSFDPLRVYYYAKNIYVRICKLPYNPNDFSNTNTYVISDEFIPGFEFPEIKKYFERGFSYKESFDTYLREGGHDPQKIYDQVEDAIHSIVIQKEPEFIKSIARRNARFGKHHFFEMFRFDFLIDSKLNLHLMEVNLSPNLHASKKIHNNKHLMENAIYNVMNLIGVGSYLKKRHIRQFEIDDEDFLCHDNSISTELEVCMSDPCLDSCDSPKCQICIRCMDINVKFDLKMAYLEHMNMGEMKRAIPPPHKTLKVMGDQYWENLSPANKLYSKWCIEMCKKNRHFC